MSRYVQPKRLLPLLGIVATPVCLALLGVTHPHTLTAETAPYWYTLHVLLIPVFPLLGVNIWWLLADVSGMWAWAARVLAFIYMPFYGALDVLAGIGTGAVAQQPQWSDQPALAAVTRLLFTQGNMFADVGVWAFLFACVLTSVLLGRDGTWRTRVSAVLLVAAAVSFLQSHIYYPIGVFTMLVMALGFAGLQWARMGQRIAPPQAHGG